MIAVVVDKELLSQLANALREDAGKINDSVTARLLLAHARMVDSIIKTGQTPAHYLMVQQAPAFSRDYTPGERGALAPPPEIAEAQKKAQRVAEAQEGLDPKLVTAVGGPMDGTLCPISPQMPPGAYTLIGEVVYQLSDTGEGLTLTFDAQKTKERQALIPT